MGLSLLFFTKKCTVNIYRRLNIVGWFGKLKKKWNGMEWNGEESKERRKERDIVLFKGFLGRIERF